MKPHGKRSLVNCEMPRRQPERGVQLATEIQPRVQKKGEVGRSRRVSPAFRRCGPGHVGRERGWREEADQARVPGHMLISRRWQQWKTCHPRGKVSGEKSRLRSDETTWKVTDSRLLSPPAISLSSSRGPGACRGRGECGHTDRAPLPGLGDGLGSGASCDASGLW